MRKLVLFLMLFFFLISCGNNKEKKIKEEIQPVTEKVEKEIQSMDSIVNTIDIALSNIEAADRKLVEALKEIE
jgi:uncharacterized protein YcfL